MAHFRVVKGGLNAENYITITKAERATATSDLQDLVTMVRSRKQANFITPDITRISH
jgi:Fic family protein